MSLLNMLSAGQWQTSYNTLYSQGTSQGTSTSYTSYWNTTYSQATSSSWQTSYPTGYGFSTSWLTEWETYACVHVDSFIPGIGRAKDVKVGDTLHLCNEKLEESTGTVSYSETKTVKGRKITTDVGATLICSDSAPFQTRTFCFVPDELLGKEVAVNVGGFIGWSKIVKVEDVGKIEVQHITVGDRCFWAGETEDAYILHHNAKMSGSAWVTGVFTSKMTSTSYSSYWSTNNNWTTSWLVQTSAPAGYGFTTYWTTSYNVLTTRLTGN